MGNQRARSRGLRHGTRNMFSRAFRKKGPNNAETYLRTFRVRAPSRIDFPGPAALRCSRVASPVTSRARDDASEEYAAASAVERARTSRPHHRPLRSFPAMMC